MSLIVEKRNSEVFLRPRFSIELTASAAVVRERFLEAFKNKETSLKGTIVDNHIFISILAKDDHFWSPQLHLEVIESTQNSSELKGLFGPKPQVWTLFMFVHFMLAFGFIGFLALLYSKYSLKESLVFPISMLVGIAILWLLLYLFGSFGKETGKKQMKRLHDFMISVIDS